MVFILRLLQAVFLKRKHEEYIELKKASLKDQERQKYLLSRFLNWWYRTCPLICGGKRSQDRKLNKLDKFQIRILKEGTYENYIAKSILGFTSGVLLTFMFFAFFALQLNFSLRVSTCMSAVLGIILTLGLAFSSRVRCVVLMFLPQFFSKRGRQAIIAYAYILALTGPAKNTLHNMRVLSETMACNQGKLKVAVKSIVELIKKPFQAIRDTVKQVAERVKIIVDKVKAMIEAIKKTLQSLLGVITHAYDWLNSIVGMCSKKVGTPFERCMKAFDGAIEDCKEKLGPVMNWMCSTAYIASHLCYAVKSIDYVCDLIEFVSDDVVREVKKKLEEFTVHVKNIFYVSIEFSHAFEFSTEQSKSIKDVSAGIMEEIKNKTKKLNYFFDWMSLALSFFFLFMVLRVLNYKRKFMANDAYDNHFITDNIIQVDVQRTKQGLETILPLNIYEKRKYAYIASIRLVKAEKSVIAKSAIFLALSTVKLLIHMLLDYSLYWILNIIRIHGQYETHIDAPNTINVQVDGKGMLSELYASVLNAFQPSGTNVGMDISPCLPEPLPPNLAKYKQIGILLAIAWLLSFTEPYGLRLRFAVMSYYYPDRARVRAVWLYNNILRSRGSFLKYARRQLRKKFVKGEEGIEEISLIDRLRAKCPLLRKIWKGKTFTACLLCGSIGSKDSPLVKCPRPDCVGVYCVHCYATLQNLCTICRLPIEYGDISDISEERDSSEERYPNNRQLEYAERTTDTSEELSLTAALLPDEGESELSYGYQYRERDLSERMSFPSNFKDLEAQKPKDRATLNDLNVKASSSKERVSLTLAERKKSGVWGFIPDEDKEPTNWSQLKQSKRSSQIKKLIEKRTLTADETAQLLDTDEVNSEESKSPIASYFSVFPSEKNMTLSKQIYDKEESLPEEETIDQTLFSQNNKRKSNDEEVCKMKHLGYRKNISQAEKEVVSELKHLLLSQDSTNSAKKYSRKKSITFKDQDNSDEFILKELPMTINNHEIFGMPHNKDSGTTQLSVPEPIKEEESEGVKYTKEEILNQPLKILLQESCFADSTIDRRNESYGPTILPNYHDHCSFCSKSVELTANWGKSSRLKHCNLSSECLDGKESNKSMLMDKHSSSGTTEAGLLEKTSKIPQSKIKFSLTEASLLPMINPKRYSKYSKTKKSDFTLMPSEQITERRSVHKEAKSIKKQEPEVHFIQKLSADIKNKSFTQQRQNMFVRPSSKSLPKSEMIRKWIDTGAYHNSNEISQQRQQEQEVKFLNKTTFTQTSIHKIFESFKISRYWKKWKTTNNDSTTHIELVENQRRTQLNFARERKKEEFVKQIETKNTFWSYLGFSGKKSMSSNLSSISSTTWPESSVSKRFCVDYSGKNIFTEKDQRKHSYKKSLYRPTHAQLVSDRFEVEDNVSSN